MKKLLLLASLFAAAFAANPFGPKTFGTYLPSSDAADFRVGFWDIARFDPLYEQPRLPENLVLNSYPGDGTGWYLVQFSGPVTGGQIAELNRTGAQFLGFHSRYTAFVKANHTTMARVTGLGFVRWAGVYQPGYKFWSGTLQEQGFGRVSVTLFYPENLTAAARELEELGFEVVRTGVSEYVKVIEVDCAREDLALIARLPWVMNIEEWHPAEPENVDCQWVAQTWAQNQRRVWDQGLFGEGEILGYSDGQIDQNHYAFRDQAVPITDTGEFPTHRKIVALKKYPPARLGSADSHGTHVGGTIAGNDSANGGTSLNDGHSKSARLVQLSPIPQPPGNDFTEPLNIITNYLRNPELRPRTVSCSWWTLTMGQYTNAASTFDLFSWKNKDIQTIKSCGNQGQSSEYRITEPGNSKSIIAVASLQNGTNSTILSTYSSRGPAPDGRIKPDVSSPGENIMSAQSGSSNGYVSMSGTSMAAPAVNGSVGLLRN
ncbi:MAG: S8 family serine peptidase, partial [candidate division WOR-3 bacterium]